MAFQFVTFHPFVAFIMIFYSRAICLGIISPPLFMRSFRPRSHRMAFQFNQRRESPPTHLDSDRSQVLALSYGHCRPDIAKLAGKEAFRFLSCAYLSFGAI